MYVRYHVSRTRRKSSLESAAITTRFAHVLFALRKYIDRLLYKNARYLIIPWTVLCFNGDRR